LSYKKWDQFPNEEIELDGLLELPPITHPTNEPELESNEYKESILEDASIEDGNGID
jgi:hypothetical protein